MSFNPGFKGNVYGYKKQPNFLNFNLSLQYNK